MASPASSLTMTYDHSTAATLGALRRRTRVEPSGAVERAGMVPTPVAEAPSDAQRDRDLVERHRVGDRQAFEEYYRRYSALVYNLALRQCGDGELAQDLAQEAFLRLFRNLGKFEGRSSLKTWTYRVVINHCRSRLSRRRPAQQLALDEQGHERDIRDDRRGPDGRVEAADSRRQIAAALLEVEDSYREALVLRDLEDLTYQEIAEVLGVPVGTVRSRIARGRDRLRNVLAAHVGGSKARHEEDPS